ncbi:MAG: magnesium/cobalt transporter CorA [Pirellulales bacterium]|nr:magnesium/cobalt transporter CorA [Pirellulales bacterium]
MAQNRKSRRKKAFQRRTPPGAQPGTIAVDPAAGQPVVEVWAIGTGKTLDTTVKNLDELPEIVARHTVTWINVDGLGDARTLQRLGSLFRLHPLALEDVVNVHQRAKVDHYENSLFIVTRMLRLNRPEECAVEGDGSTETESPDRSQLDKPANGHHEPAARLGNEQLSMFLMDKVVITFQDSQPGDCFSGIRDRLRKGDENYAAHGADYFAYRLLDAVIDSYFPILEAYGERIENLEEELLESQQPVKLQKIHEIKQDLLLIRRAIWPAREMLHSLARDINPLIKEETRIYLRDCYDHTVQILDLLETYRELGSDLRDLYLSSVSQRMNEIMKVLTIISTLFIPLTFIAGVYGMNFQYDPETAPFNMPELYWYWGYPAFWTLMIVITLGMLWYFVRKGWIGSGWWR